MLQESPTKRSDGMDKLYSEEDMKRYDAFLSHFKDPIEGMREYHKVYAQIYNNPARREILKTLIDGEKTVEDIGEEIKMSKEELIYQLNMLGFCIESEEREGKVYFKLTKEGERIKLDLDQALR